MLAYVKTIRSTSFAFVCGTWTMLSILIILMRVIKIQYQTVAFGVMGTGVYVSDIILLLTILIVGLVIIFLLRNASHLAHKIFLFASTAVAILIGGLEIVACRFAVVSGSTLDFNLIYYALKNLREVRWVAGSETPLWLSATLVILLMAFISIPIIFSRFWSSRIYRPGPSSSKTSIVVFLIVLITLLALAYLQRPNIPAYATNATLFVAATSIPSEEEDQYPPPATDLFETTDTKLVGTSDTNVVIILLESTRASATSLHNPAMTTTPFLKQLSKESLWMERAYPVVPHTSKALTSALCGIPPSPLMPIIEAMEGALPANCLAMLLKEKGYQSAFFQPAIGRFENRPQHMKNMGYDSFVPQEKLPTEGFKVVNIFGYEDNILLEPSRDWLRKERKNGPLFLTYLTLTPHHDYDPPHTYGFENYDPNEKYNKYLNAVHYVDRFVSNVFDIFKEEGLYENTIFVIVGDHGEGFGEHGLYHHDAVIWEEGIHIPFLIHHAGSFRGGKKISNITSHLDIVPTVLAMMNLEPVGGVFPGQDIRNLEEDRMLFVHCFYDRKCMAALKGDEKYIYRFGIDKDEFYNLKHDPLERKNLIDTTSVEEWKASALTWRSGVNAIYRKQQEKNLSKK